MSGAEGKPVLTPEQVQRLWEIGGYDKPAFEAELQRMGLLPEPVDALLIEAREVCARDSEAGGWRLAAKEYRDGERDESVPMRIALRALRRGKELGQAAARPLTREMVGEAYRESGGFGTVQFVDRLHTALLSQMEGRDG